MRIAVLFALVVAFVALICGAQAALFSSSDPVTILTDSNFESTVLKSKETWVVIFASEGCGHCQSFKAAYAQSAKAMVGVAKYGLVDNNNRATMGKYNISGFPTVKIFTPDAKEPVDFNGAREAKALSQAVLKEIREMISARLNGGASKSAPKNPKSAGASSGPSGTAGGAVIELTDKTFSSSTSASGEAWLVSFTAPWCGHCKALKPAYKDAAKAFSPTSPVRFANVDCTVHQSVCSKFGVQGYPTIKAFINGKVQDYNGGRAKDDLVSYMRTYESKLKTAPKPVELLNQAQLDTCLQESVCIFASLHDLRDSSAQERKDYIKILTDAATKNKDYSIGWVYSFAREHRELENSLQMGSNGFPAITLIHKAKSISSPMYRSFTLENINEWASKAGKGQVTQTIPFKTLPAITTVQAWDGQDLKKEKEDL